MRSSWSVLGALSVLLLCGSEAGAEVYSVKPSGVISFDPLTGSVTNTGIPAPAGGIYQGVSAADVSGRRLFVLGTDFTPGQSLLTTISLTTGSISQVTVTGTSQFIEYDPLSQMIYALQPAGIVPLIQPPAPSHPRAFQRLREGSTRERARLIRLGDASSC